MRFHTSLALLAVLAVPVAAMATTVPINVNGTGLGSVGSADPNWTLVSAPFGVPLTATITNANPVWFQPIGNFQWINPSGVDTAGEPTGAYVYETTFSIGSGFNPASAILNMHLAADDSVDVYLNGNLEFSYGAPAYPHTMFTTITSGFIHGTNTLEFVSQNSGGGPEGVYAEVNGTVDTSPVPEPSSLMLLGTGIVGLAGAARRKLFRA